MINPHFNFFHQDIVFQEVPGEVSLLLYISGCPLRCEGCHSPEGWNLNSGSELNDEVYSQILTKYRNLATCVVFMGGEWLPEELVRNLITASCHGYKTCLYTGLELSRLDPIIPPHLNYVKVGRWIPSMGGLNSPNTNQRFYELQGGDVSRDITFKFAGRR